MNLVFNIWIGITQSNSYNLEYFQIDDVGSQIYSVSYYVTMDGEMATHSNSGQITALGMPVATN